MTRDLTYAVVLEPQPEGGFTATVPALPEVVSQGETEQEALDMVREAIELAIEVRVERGEDVGWVSAAPWGSCSSVSLP